MPPPKHVPFWEGPTLEEGTPRVSRELRGAGAPRTRRKKGADSGPAREEHPLAINLAEIRNFVPGSKLGKRL